MTAVAIIAHSPVLLADLGEMPAAHPAPVIPGREARPGEMPAAAARWVKQATAGGWIVQTRYALGHAYGRPGRPGPLTHSAALRMGHPATLRRAVITWHRVDGRDAWTPAGGWVGIEGKFWMPVRLLRHPTDAQVLSVAGWLAGEWEDHHVIGT